MQISAILSKLALHFWRPDFTPTQVKHLTGDFLRDLEPFTVRDIANACASWRRDPDNKFFPTPGGLIGILRQFDTPPHKGHARPIAPESRQITQQFATKFRPVSEILRENGHLQAAELYAARYEASQPNPPASKTDT